MLKYWEHYNNVIRESVDWTIESAEILFPKKDVNEKTTCLSIYKNQNEKYHLNLSYYIGIDWIPNTKQTIYVAPKLNTKLNLNGTKDNNVTFDEIKQTDYLSMLFCALSHPDIDTKSTVDLFYINWNSEQIEIEQEIDLLTPLIVVQFLRIVHEIVRKVLKNSYYKVEQNLYSRVKGKILVGQTIKQNHFKNKPLNTICSFDEFGVNGLENRLLKKALVFISRYLPTLKIPNSEKYTTEVFNYIMPAFEYVSDEINLNDIKHSKTNAFYKEYEEGIRLAKLILKRFGYNINSTIEQTIKTPPFWIDMSKLFELYVLGLLKEKFEGEVEYQFQGNYGQSDFLLTKQQIIVDAKYKTYYEEEFKGQDQWKRDIIASDIRQISGYARDKDVLRKIGISTVNQLISVPKCLIIYPDQNCNDINFSNHSEIKEFVNFYKAPINLPIIKNKS
jgi:5-methylcytosine-specific restriction enzyme subunit McrC